MSSEQFSQSVDECRRKFVSIRKDLKFRQEQAARQESTYALDAEIRGEIGQVDIKLSSLNSQIGMYRTNPSSYGITTSELEKRAKLVQQLNDNRAQIQRTFDGFFNSRSNNAPNNGLDSSQSSAPQQPVLTKQQLLEAKRKEEEAQEEILGDIINTVKNMKKGGESINKELKEQDKMLDVLDQGVDQNSNKVNRVRKGMAKLLEDSSNCCLITAIIGEIAGIVAILVLWN